MKRLLLILCLTALLAGCRRADPAVVAARVAKTCYDSLLAGHTRFFVEMTYHPDRLPDHYREQLNENMLLFLKEQRERHDGIREVAIASASADTARHSANVFLILTYGDSTREEVVVPMVERDGVWLLR